jgi:hypothetical protein
MRSSGVAQGGLAVVAIVLGASCGAPPSPGEDVVMQEAELITSTSFTYDGFTQCTVGGTGMHCCPTDQAMIGAHVDQNVFKCAPLTVPRTGARFLDTGTQRNGMHSCPFGSVMVGLRADVNRLACQALAVFVSESVDTGTQDGFPMHVCAGGNTMTGIRIDRNQLNCGNGTSNITTCQVNGSCGGCDVCNDGSVQSGFITSCANPISPLCQTTNLCAKHGGVNPNVGCSQQP